MPSKVYNGQRAALATPGAALDYIGVAKVEVQISGASGTWTPQRSLDGVTWVPWFVFDKDDNKVTSITTNGIFNFDGYAHFRFTGGSGGTWTVSGRN